LTIAALHDKINYNPMGTNCVTLLADLFLHLYETEFIQAFSLEKRKPFSHIAI